MTTTEVLKQLRLLVKRRGWSAQLRQTHHIRFKSPGESRYRRNPLSALAFHLDGKVNHKWEVPGKVLGLSPTQIDDFHFACDLRWFRPLLRKQILQACGVEDEKFDQAFEFIESILPKRKSEHILNKLSSEDRIALENVTEKCNNQVIEEILRKY